MKMNFSGLIGMQICLIVTASSSWGGFTWPAKGKLTPENLMNYVNDYSTQVATCLHVEELVKTKEQRLWCDVRDALYSDLITLRRSLDLPETVENIISDRDKLCQTIVENLVDINFNGTQFGNCGEAGFVFYCLAHQAGYRNLMTCNTTNDHTFAVFLKQTGSNYDLCLLDRWNLGLGHYACGIEIDKGVLKHPHLKTKNNWYENLDCSDPLNKSSNLTTKSISHFDGNKWATDFRDVSFQVAGENNPREVLNHLRAKYPFVNIQLIQKEPGKVKVVVPFKDEDEIENFVKDLKKENFKFSIETIHHEILIDVPDLKTIRSKL